MAVDRRGGPADPPLCFVPVNNGATHLLPILSAAVVANDPSLRARLAAIVHSARHMLRLTGCHSGIERDHGALLSERPDMVILATSGISLVTIKLMKALAPAELIMCIDDASHAAHIVALRPASVLLMPFTDEAVFNALRRSADMLLSYTYPTLQAQYHGMSRGGSRIALPLNDGVAIVAVDDILHCHRNGKGTVEVCACHDQPLFVRSNLKQLSERLAHHGFLRIHPSHLVNRGHIVRCMPDRVFMRDGTCLPIAHGQKSHVSKTWDRPARDTSDERPLNEPDRRTTNTIHRK